MITGLGVLPSQAAALPAVLGPSVGALRPMSDGPSGQDDATAGTDSTTSGGKVDSETTSGGKAASETSSGKSDAADTQSDDTIGSASPASGLHTRTMDDGARIRVRVIGATAGVRKPVLLVPTTRPVDSRTFTDRAERLLHGSGYLVVAYTVRGFGRSTGSLQLAGPRDVADAERLITWATTALGGDRRKVGMLGISYGASVALMTAAHDARVRAVVAVSPWTDLADMLAPGGTASLRAGRTVAAWASDGRTGGALAKALDAYLSGDPTDVLESAAERSPASATEGLTASRPAVLLTTGGRDTLTAPDAALDFLASLTGPARLEIADADHPAETDTSGGPSKRTWTQARRWLDHYLRGKDNGVQAEAPLQWQARGERTWEEFDSVADATGTVQSYWPSAAPIGESTALDRVRRTGTLAGTADGPWTWSVTGGLVSGAAVGTDLDVGEVDRAAAGVWTGPVLEHDAVVAGSPLLHLGVVSSTPRTTLVAALYEQDADGVARPITYQVTDLAGTAGQEHVIDLRLQAVRRSVAAGSRLVLVLDTFDPAYRDSTWNGSTVGLTSPAGDPARLDVPFD